MKITIGILGFMLLLITGVYAHGGSWYTESNIHEEVEEIIESGTYMDLETLRDEYNVPIMHWIDNAEDFELIHGYHEELELTPHKRVGGCHGW